MALAEQYLSPCLCDKWNSKMVRTDAVQKYPSVKKNVHIRKEMLLRENIPLEFTQEQPAGTTLITISAIHFQIALYTLPQSPFFKCFLLTLLEGNSLLSSKPNLQPTFSKFGCWKLAT